MWAREGGGQAREYLCGLRCRSGTDAGQDLLRAWHVVSAPLARPGQLSKSYSNLNLGPSHACPASTPLTWLTPFPVPLLVSPIVSSAIPYTPRPLQPPSPRPPAAGIRTSIAFASKMSCSTDAGRERHQGRGGAGNQERMRGKGAGRAARQQTVTSPHGPGPFAPHSNRPVSEMRGGRPERSGGRRAAAGRNRRQRGAPCLSRSRRR